MKVILSILILSTLALTYASHNWKNPCPKCNTVPVEGREFCVFSKKQRQKVTDRTVLFCSEGSYFSRIEYNGRYKMNTSCNAIFASQDDGCSEGIYHAYHQEDCDINCDDHGTKLSTDNYSYYIAFNQGNSQWYEKAVLSNCECDGDIISAYSSYIAVDPIKGCCNDGTRHIQAISYRLKIYGKCCSECFLLQSSLTYQKEITNF